MYVLDLMMDSFTAGSGGSEQTAMVTAGRYIQALRPTAKVTLLDILAVAGFIMAAKDSPTVAVLGQWLNDNAGRLANSVWG